MNYGVILASLIVLPYSSAFLPGSAGNPERDAYVGHADSIYDAAANPARTMGAVTYDPMAPLPENASMSQNGGPATPAPMPAPLPTR